MKKYFSFSSAIVLISFSVLITGCLGGSGSDTTNNDAYQAPSPAPAPRPAPNPAPTPAPTPEEFTILSTNPNDGALGLAVNGTITVSFSNPIDTQTVYFNSGLSLDNVIMKKATAPNDLVAIQVQTIEPNKLSIRPQVDLAPGTSYTVEIQSTLRDTYGQRLATSLNMLLTTANQTGSNPSVIKFSLIQGAGVGVTEFKIFYGTTSGLNADHPITPPNDFIYNVEGAGITLVTNPSTPTPDPLPEDTPFSATLSTGLFTSGQTYYFSVKACNSHGCSGYSQQASKTMP